MAILECFIGEKVTPPNGTVPRMKGNVVLFGLQSEKAHERSRTNSCSVSDCLNIASWLLGFLPWDVHGCLTHVLRSDPNQRATHFFRSFSQRDTSHFREKHAITYFMETEVKNTMKPLGRLVMSTNICISYLITCFSSQDRVESLHDQCSCWYLKNYIYFSQNFFSARSECPATLGMQRKLHIDNSITQI